MGNRKALGVGEGGRDSVWQHTKKKITIKSLRFSTACKGELSAGSEDGDSRVQDDFEHPFMLYPGLRNRTETKADGIFGRDKIICEFDKSCSIDARITEVVEYGY